MPRLIDADAIPYKKIMYDDDDFYYGVTQPYIDRMPTIDAVPVCRCKDCRYGTIDQYSAGEYVVVCDAPKKRPGTDVYALDWYCPMGQRREDGDTSE